MTKFADLGLDPKVLSAITTLGYEQPTPVQQECIPLLLSGVDVLAQAQTGTGKTAAFALPILTKINLKLPKTQALVLAPTRELAIQVAEAFHSYAKKTPGFHVLPIYGGQEYGRQIKALKRGAHVVVGTPGRVMDHIKKGNLKFEDLQTLVLDEADEMLKMGFIEDVQWILQQIPNQHQTALFSATMPKAIHNIANKYLRDPRKVEIKAKTQTIDTIDQYYTVVTQHNKLEALTRFLEIEDANGILIFTRTKVATAELAEKLEARGFTAAAMNGDMKQSLREKVIARIKRGSLDIVVATEVAARGLDVERISHVINYDIPYDPESYIHRIGRTGRAGRSGKSLLFVTPRERRMLREIERVIKMPIPQIQAPSAKQINKKRAEDFSDKISAALQDPKLDSFREFIEEFRHSSEHSTLDIAAALASIAQPTKRVEDQNPINTGFAQENEKSKRHRNRTGTSRRRYPGSEKTHFANKRLKKRRKTDSA